MWLWRVVLVAALSAGIAAAARAETVQVTDLPTNRTASLPSISRDGRYVTFSSNGNIGGLNPVPQINVFVYEPLTTTYTKITTLGGANPTISGDGRWVAFRSFANYTLGNADESDEIFRYDRVQKRFSQVTRDYLGEGSSDRPAINGNGTRIAFESNSNLSRRNPDFSNELFVYRSGPVLAASVDPEGEGESINPAISGDGRFVVFETTSNLGRNLDLSQELMLYDMATLGLVQLTYDAEGFGSSYNATINEDGRYIAFVSSSNLFLMNPDGFDAIYLWGRVRPMIITATASGVFSGDTPSINDDGRWVAFVSSSSPTAQNADRNREVFLFDTTRRMFTQLTTTSACVNSNPKISGDGTKIAFLSTCDLLGTNADKSREIFLIDNPAFKLAVHAEGPVNVEVRDPLDRLIRHNLNMIPFATYETGDFDEDGIAEVDVAIPRAIDGQYVMSLFPTLNATAEDAVKLEATLNGTTVFLADDSLGNLTADAFVLNIQGMTRPSGRINPVDDLRSRLTLGGTLIPEPSPTGLVTLRVSDGENELLFDFGRYENFTNLNGRRQFRGSVSGFNTSLLIYNLLAGGARLNLTASAGDLSMFAGTGHKNMTVVLRIGNETYLYQRRFNRRSLGDLVLLP
jgi:Tol biopolymer transport system component